MHCFVYRVCTGVGKESVVFSRRNFKRRYYSSAVSRVEWNGLFLVYLSIYAKEFKPGFHCGKTILREKLLQPK